MPDEFLTVVPATDKDALYVLRLAYVALLGMPFGEYRDRQQRTLGLIRDVIAKLSGEDAGAVQSGHEALAAYCGGVMLDPPPLSKAIDAHPGGRLAALEVALRGIGNIAYNMKQNPVGWNAEEQFARIQRLADAALAGQPDPEYSAKPEGRS